MTAQTFKTQKGFTLIELLVVIGILAILLAITLIAINPAARFGQANNTKRNSDVLQILNSIHQHVATNGGNLPAEVAALNAGTVTTLNNTNFPNLCGELVTDFIPALPVDPNGNDQDGIETADCDSGLPTATPVVAWDTQYTITRDAQGRITVAAPNAYGGVVISVTR